MQNDDDDDIDLYSLVLYISEFPQGNQAIQVTIMVKLSSGTMKRAPIVILEHVLMVLKLFINYRLQLINV